jgi:hypothetical protein
LFGTREAVQPLRQNSLLRLCSLKGRRDQEKPLPSLQPALRRKTVRQEFDP